MADVRDADELNEALQIFIALPESFVPPGGAPIAERWGELFLSLTSERRGLRAVVSGTTYWVAAERAKMFSSVFPKAKFGTQPAELDEAATTKDEAFLTLVRGWMAHVGPVETSWLAGTLGIPADEIASAMAQLEAEGRVLRGQFTGAAELEWCDRRLLARIHRLTLGTLRQEICPVTAAQFMRWLLRWQHIAPATQVLGERGTLEVIQQLQGFEAPANAWEPSILARRVAGYDPQILDRLCLTGAVGWGRLSPHPATLELIVNTAPLERDLDLPRSGTQRRVVPSSVTPITFFVRDDSEWMIPRHAPTAEDSCALSHGAR